MKQLIFLKLGGSLITDKDQPHTANFEVIRFLAKEILGAIQNDPDLTLLLGHGSGSFGHVPASQYHTREGVRTTQEWRGFAKVWHEASALNRILVDEFTHAGMPLIALPPSAAITATNGKVETWNTSPISSALAHHLVPVIFGDVIFDRILGGTIFSTEQLFVHLAGVLQPDRILITGSETGVWEDYPTCTRLISEITPETYPEIVQRLFPSRATDVTGGMAGKVHSMVDLVKEMPALEVSIFNPTQPGTLARAMHGEPTGTTIHR